MSDNKQNVQRIWGEADYEPDDVAAINILARKNIDFSHFVSGEGDASIKHARSATYYNMLCDEDLCKYQGTYSNYLSGQVLVHLPIFIKGIGSDKPFPKDGHEFPNGLDKVELLYHEQYYVDQFKNFVKANPNNPVMVILKPFRELMKYADQLSNELAQTTLWIYGSFNFRTLIPEYGAEKVLKVLNSFKRVYMYEAFLACKNKEGSSSLNQHNMPEFYKRFMKLKETSPYIQVWNQLIINWNEHIFEWAQGALKRAQEDEKSGDADKIEKYKENTLRAQKIYDAIKENKDFQMICADIGVAVTFQNEKFASYYKPVHLEFVPDSNYSKPTVVQDSKIFCAFDIPWELLEQELVKLF